ncbi:MAG: hypothetical protein ACRDD8_06215 [Bacteroidales bacterium]
MEHIKQFKDITDKMVYGVFDPDKTPLVEISGYDLRVKFNLSKIKSLEEAQDASSALAEVFLKALIEQLLEDQTNTES